MYTDLNRIPLVGFVLVRVRFLKKFLRGLLLTPLILFGLFLGWVWLLGQIPVPSSAFMLQHNVRAFFSEEIDYVRYRWVPLQEIPPALRLAVIASEDQKFPDHFGIDIEATRAAIQAYREGRSSGGGSTITQQVAKNLFLWGDRSRLRKVLEWGLAILLEWMWSKERILEVYLNIAQMGKQEYGVGAAADYLLQKPVASITAQEAALIAAVLPSPARFDLRQPSAYMRSRQAFILRQMNALGGERYLQRLSAP